VTRLKLDENLPDVVGQLLGTAGHDAATAREVGLAGAADDILLATAQSEARVLVTLDHDFANVRRYDPAPIGRRLHLEPLDLHDRLLHMRESGRRTWKL